MKIVRCTLHLDDGAGSLMPVHCGYWVYRADGSRVWRPFWWLAKRADKRGNPSTP